MSAFSISETNGIFSAIEETRDSFQVTVDFRSVTTLSDLLNCYYSNGPIRFPSAILTESHGIVIVASAIKHTFPSNKSQWFVGVIAPRQKAGIYSIKADSVPSPLYSFELTDAVRVENLDFPGLAVRDSFNTTSCIPIPTPLLRVFELSEFDSVIDPKHLALKINESNLPEQAYQELLDFLFQAHISCYGTEIIRLSNPSSRGRESWSKFRQYLLDYPTQDGRNLHQSVNDEQSFASEDSDREESSPPPTNREVSSNSSSEDSTSAELSPYPKRQRTNYENHDILPWIKELQALNTTIATHILNAPSNSQATQILSLEDKSSWYKKSSETVRDWLINLRAGPNLLNPTELSTEMDSILKRISSKQQADIQIPMIISKMLNVRHFDCMATGQDFENWFKHGEFKQSKMVNDFSHAFGLNFHSVGPKDPMSKPIAVTSSNGLKHKVFVPSHFVELEDSAYNLLAIVSVIAGANHDSFATLALKELLKFYKSFKADIKQMCEIRGNLIQDIQMQLGNEWNAFLIRTSVESPDSGPDFAYVTNQIAKGKPPIPFLTESYSGPSFNHKQHIDRKPKYKKGIQQSGDRSNPVLNSNPQIQMEGSSDSEKSENYRKAFARRGVFRELNLPRVDSAGNSDNNGRDICMNFHVRHKCLRNNCSLFHGKISEEVITALLTKTKHLKVKRM